MIETALVERDAKEPHPFHLSLSKWLSVPNRDPYEDWQDPEGEPDGEERWVKKTVLDCVECNK